jgi:hypothetical protein
MNEFLATYLEPLLLFISGGGLATVFTIKYTRKTAQADAMKAVQDVYQETIRDLRSDKELIKQENKELRDQVTRLEKIVKQNCADIRQLKGFKCVRMDCKERITD